MSCLWLQLDVRRRCCNSVFLSLANPRHNSSWQGRGLILSRRNSNESGSRRHPLRPHAAATKAARFAHHFGYFDMHKRTRSTNSPSKLPSHKQSKHDHDDSDVSHEDEKQNTPHSFGHSHNSHGANGHSHTHGAEELVAAFRGASTSLSTLTK